REQSLLDGRVRHDRAMPPAHPGQEIPLDAAAFEVVEDLVRHDALEAALDLCELLHVVDVEVAHARVTDLLRLEEIVESRQRFLEGNVAAPMKQIEVDLLNVQPAEAPITGRGHAVTRGVLWIELRHDEHLIAAAGDRLADEPLRASLRIHLRCVDERHAELDPAAQRGNLVLAFARGLAHAPGALPEDGHGLSAW